MRHDLLTEARNPASSELDTLPTLDLVRVMNEADKQIAAAVERELAHIAEAVDAIAERIETGGRLFYMGAGTSGRLGVLDASECPPTFNTPPGTVVGLIAGGDYALRHSVEGAEDDPELGRADLEAHSFTGDDALVGIAASGRTPYVLGALAQARKLGGLTVALSCTANSEIAIKADIAITPIPGPEILTGSTRLRAGTATKLVLNMLSTGVMIRLGYVYGNLMVNVQPTNEKLVDRSRRIIAELTNVSYDQAGALLASAGSVRLAVLMHQRALDKLAAEQLLGQHRGNLRSALRA